jgi:hypothetical protein
MPICQLVTTGRGFGAHVKGERITDITSAQTGALLLEHSRQFNTDNVILVTREFENRVWATFVDPFDWKRRDGQEFCIWQHDLDLNTIEIWRVKF